MPKASTNKTIQVESVEASSTAILNQTDVTTKAPDAHSAAKAIPRGSGSPAAGGPMVIAIAPPPRSTWDSPRMAGQRRVIPYESIRARSSPRASPQRPDQPLSGRSQMPGAAAALPLTLTSPPGARSSSGDMKIASPRGSVRSVGEFGTFGENSLADQEGDREDEYASMYDPPADILQTARSGVSRSTRDVSPRSRHALFSSGARSKYRPGGARRPTIRSALPPAAPESSTA